MFKCTECGENDVEAEDEMCDICFYSDEEDEDDFEEEDEE